MQAVFEKIIEKLEEEKMSYFLTIANTGDEKLDCAYEHTGDALDKAIEIVKQEAERYEECYKNCGDCEAYDKEKFYCPKFCKVIKETVKEIEENHNIKGKWEMTYNGMRKNANTGLMMTVYHCKCSVCGWVTGNQGTRFSYCPNCGAKMDEED